jgi:hypothetical protein
MSVLFHNAYADSYRLGTRYSSLPLIIYFGGAIPPETYNLRRETEPLAILSEFQSAVEHLQLDAAELLVVPNPPVMRTEPDYRRRVIKFVTEELVPRVREKEVESMALLGFSYGAYIASTLAFELTQVRALAAIGGIGMAEPLSESDGKLCGAKSYLCFANRDDMIGGNSRQFSTQMGANGIRIGLIEREGGHSFDDYATNCSVRHAFSFLLESCFEPPFA